MADIDKVLEEVLIDYQRDTVAIVQEDLRLSDESDEDDETHELEEPLFNLEATTLNAKFRTSSNLFGNIISLMVLDCSKCKLFLHMPIMRSVSKGREKPAKMTIIYPQSLACPDCDNACKACWYIPSCIPAGGVFLQSFQNARARLRSNKIKGIVETILELHLALETYGRSQKSPIRIHTWKAAQSASRSCLPKFIQDFPEMAFDARVASSPFFSAGIDHLEQIVRKVESLSSEELAHACDIWQPYFKKSFHPQVPEYSISKPTIPAAIPSGSKARCSAPLSTGSVLDGFHKQTSETAKACQYARKRAHTELAEEDTVQHVKSLSSEEISEAISTLQSYHEALQEFQNLPARYLELRKMLPILEAKAQNAQLLCLPSWKKVIQNVRLPHP